MGVRASLSLRMSVSRKASTGLTTCVAASTPAGRVRRALLADHFALRVGDLLNRDRRDALAAIRQRGKGVGQFDQRNLAGAERQAQAVVGARQRCHAEAAASNQERGAASPPAAPRTAGMLRLVASAVRTVIIPISLPS
jgi:hypothetical protein